MTMLVLLSYLVQNKMKSRRNIRIVCLKNSNNKIKHHSGLLVAGLLREQKQKLPSAAPSLAYLSATLQFGKDSNRDDRNRYRSLMGSGVESFRTLDDSETQALNVQEQKSFPTILNFVEKQKKLIDTNKESIVNLMGSIDLSSKKSKRLRISRNIRDNLDKLGGREILINKNNKKQRNYSLQNKNFLQEDFHEFLYNKKQEARAKQPKLEEVESHRIKILSVINPQKEVDNTHEEGLKLNLFSFQAKSNPRKDTFLTLPSFMRESPSHIGRARLDKKIFKMDLKLKTEQSQFNWSKFSFPINFQSDSLQT